MKNPYGINVVTFAFVLLSAFKVNAQVPPDSSMIKKEYSNLEEALKEPEKVYRLNLSNQNLKLPSDSTWAKFENLEYLNLKDDHLKNIPAGLGYLKKLKVLDLSGNDFKLLPQSLSKLENLEEIYLNDEKNIKLEKSLLVLKDLPNLRILHLEKDNLKSIPKSLLYFNNLEQLYLNNNRFKKVPIEVQGLKNLKYMDLHGNKFRLDHQNIHINGFGPKIRF